MKSPVVLCAYNRPALTLGVMDVVRAAQPPTLLLVADGPRAEVPGDAARCAEVRTILAQVDWPCEVLTDFAAENLGCAQRIASGITWAFQHVERAVILEDDVRPHPSFFGFCDAMLDRFADTPEVMQVTGRNPFGVWNRGDHDYLFSRAAQIWGWATWRRAWAEFDLSLDRYQSPAVEARLRDVAVDPVHAEYLTWLLGIDAPGQTDNWDVSLALSMYAEECLAVVPTRNLIANVGFGVDATHLTDETDIGSAIEVAQVDPPYRGPATVTADDQFDHALVRYERVRNLANPLAAAVAHRLLQSSAARDATRTNPAVLHSLAAFDDVAASLDILRHVHAHSRPFPPLEDRMDALERFLAPASPEGELER